MNRTLISEVASKITVECFKYKHLREKLTDKWAEQTTKPAYGDNISGGMLFSRQLI